MPLYPRAGWMLAIAACLGLGACTTERTSVPLRTATEQLLISTAADRAANELSLAIPRNTKVFIDRQYFQGYDDGYALNAIRTQFLRQGLAVVDDRKDAEAVQSTLTSVRRDVVRFAARRPGVVDNHGCASSDGLGFGHLHVVP